MLPTVSCSRKRSCPKISCWKRIFCATSCGLPTKLAPRIVREASYCSRVIGGPPRSRPILFIIVANGSQESSTACCDVSATNPCELMLSAGSSRPASAAARRWISAKGAKRSGRPPMIASAIGRPSMPARTAEPGLPPTAIHTGSGSCSGRG